MSESRYGEQPLARILREQRWTFTLMADELGVSRRQVGNAAKGWSRPIPALREQLPIILGVPLEELFTPSALEPFAAQPEHRRKRVNA
ncbi:hypothetical protein QMK17_26190 [Rhodococcus sp. G-MC3]|uniref:hypothetical protein n=1 Tax=Rhodococcus sp. G-MC3 TaxID=3046209 RepID=UPI0024BA4B9F|nr:hypothetical protein [Rhodococcus sp. G-MC3]MDJ0396780.1 hypothetical protein [Rhodococcus sp. G-MC3]